MNGTKLIVFVVSGFVFVSVLFGTDT